jgi:hypothetical protein
MGQADYGLDQSILRYQRDGARVSHQTQVLAITNAQLERMTTTSVGGRFKPMLAVEGRTLVQRNVPVPETTLEALSAASRKRVKYDLRAVQAFMYVTGVDSEARVAKRVDGEWTLVEQVLDDLALEHKTRRTRLVLTYLPVKRDLKPGHIDERREKLRAYAQRRGIEFLDLTMPMRAMRPDSLDLAFISRVPRGAAPGVQNQYSNLGHAWVAQKIVQQLQRPGVGVALTAHDQR